MIKKIKKYFDWYVLIILATITVTTIYAIAAILLVSCVGKYIIDKKPDISNMYALVVLFAPFLVSLLVERYFCKHMLEKTMLENLDDSQADEIFERFSNFLAFLITACLAFLVFLKSSTYDLLKLETVDRFSDDVLFSWIISALTTFRLTFDYVLARRTKKQQAISKNSATKQRDGKRMSTNKKRIKHRRHKRKQ